jgi:hypothetical protein
MIDCDAARSARAVRAARPATILAVATALDRFGLQAHTRGKRELSAVLATEVHYRGPEPHGVHLYRLGDGGVLETFLLKAFLVAGPFPISIPCVIRQPLVRATRQILGCLVQHTRPVLMHQGDQMARDFHVGRATEGNLQMHLVPSFGGLQDARRYRGLSRHLLPFISPRQISFVAPMHICRLEYHEPHFDMVSFKVVVNYDGVDIRRRNLVLCLPCSRGARIFLP